jgi:hypothetical protein
MSELKSLILKNKDSIPNEQYSRIMNLISKNQISYLSPDQESGAFLLYSLGNDIKTIAATLAIPVDVLALTHLYYKWDEKLSLLKKPNGELKSIADLQKDLLEAILVATLITTQKQLGDIIAGRANPNSCRLLPNNPLALEKLMIMLEKINGVKQPENQPPIQVSATNVQINTAQPQQLTGEEKQSMRINMLKQISESK